MMTGKCFDDGAIQAFLDGELDFERSEAVAHHVAACDDCAILLAVAEEESAVAFTALEQEFNTLVPTQRLWTKINDSIESEKEKQSFWTPIFAFFKQPSTAAFAGLLITAGLFAVVLNRGTVDDTKTVAKIQQNKTISGVPVSEPVTANLPPTQPLLPSKDSQLVAFSDSSKNRMKARVVPANLIEERRRTNIKSARPQIKKDIPSPANGNLTGEETYIKTIATLTETVKNRKDEVLKPSARFAFERDLAVADNAIKTMKREIKENPQDEAAKQILRSSYQNKIDLLNSVADKTELMASIK